MTPDFYGLISQMAAELDHCQRLLLGDGRQRHPLADHARAALAKADGPAVPDGREPASVALQPSDGEVWTMYDEMRGEPGDWAWVRDLVRAALARWGHHPAPPADGEVAKLVEWLHRICFDVAPCDAAAITRARELMAESVEEGPTDDEVEVWADQQGFIRGHGYHPCGFWINDGDAGALVRAALTRWGRPASQPVPVSERLPGDALSWWYEPDEDDDPTGYGGNWTLLRIRGNVSFYTHWLPAHALPTPEATND